MKSIITLIQFLMRAYALFAGLIMLVGGGICSVGIIPASFTQPGILSYLTMTLPIAVLGYAFVSYALGFSNKKTKIMNNLNSFLQKIQNQQPISFKETMAIIDESYDYKQTEFSNGLGEDKLISPAGVNQGSCKIFAFAQLHNLTPEQTLNLFGDYYHVDVLQNPDGTDHQNIRNFMKYGWEGISFQNQPLLEKKF